MLLVHEHAYMATRSAAQVPPTAPSMTPNAAVDRNHTRDRPGVEAGRREAGMA
jgi:hypothetical protein